MTEAAATHPDPDAPLWAARAAVFAHFARTGRAPDAGDLATALAVPRAEALALLAALHARHMLLLLPEGEHIHMAHPFSGIPTPFRTFANGVSYFANCAWDALGIAAALHADATILIDDPLGGPQHELHVRDWGVEGDGMIHFLIPFGRWYEDLVET